MSLRSNLFAAFVVGGAASFFAGCPCPGVSIVGWHFENDCSDDLCGFVVASGQATRVSAIAPGEHALQLEPSTEINQTLSQGLGTTGASPLSLTFVARCENGASLSATATVSVVRTSDGGTGIPTVVTLSGSISPVGDWQLYTMPLSGSTANQGFGTTAILAGLRVQTDSAGRCWIDDVGIARNAFCG